MLLGSLLLAGTTPPLDGTTFTPWMPRLADNAIFTYEVVRFYKTAGPPPPTFNPFDVKIFHKNSEDLGEGEDAGATWVQSDNIHRTTLTGLKELVRYRIHCDTVDVGGVYRILEPTWFNSV